MLQSGQMGARVSVRWLVGLVGLAAIAAAVAACAGPKLPAIPSQGGPAWVELTTAHFVVWTDASAAQGRALAEDLEHLRQVLYGVMFFHPTGDSRCFVIALRDVDEVHAFTRQLALAQTWPVTPIMQPVILLPIGHVDHERRIVTHELAHAISYSAIPNQPHWFSEGLASYFETVRLNQHTGSLVVGRPNALMVGVLRARYLLPLASLVACTRLGCYNERYYATAWALFAYLLSQRPKQLQAFMQELAAGKTIDAFGKLEPADLDRPLDDWIANGELTVTSYRVQLRDVPVTQRGLGDAEAYAARALLRYLHDPTHSIPPEVAQTLAIDPTNLVARMILDAAGVPTSSAVARKIVAAHPDDWRAWWLVAYGDPSGHEMVAARRAMCALVARNPAALPPGMCPLPAPAAPVALASDPWSAFWQARDVTPPPPLTVFDPVPTPAQLVVRNLTRGAIDDATASRWMLGDIRRDNADAWAKRHLRLDVANAGVLGPPGLNGTGREIVELQAKGVGQADGPSPLPVVAAVVAIPREARRAMHSDYAIVLAFQIDGALRWGLDVGVYREDPIIGGIWYQVRRWSCRPAGSSTIDHLCAQVARTWTPAPSLPARATHPAQH